MTTHKVKTVSLKTAKIDLGVWHFARSRSLPGAEVAMQRRRYELMLHKLEYKPPTKPWTISIPQLLAKIFSYSEMDRYLMHRLGMETNILDLVSAEYLDEQGNPHKRLLRFIHEPQYQDFFIRTYHYESDRYYYLSREMGFSGGILDYLMEEESIGAEK